MLKRQTAILPFDPPCLSDKNVAQLIDLLHQLLEGIEHHYAAQIHRYQKRQRQSPASSRRAAFCRIASPSHIL